jgi:hypothetical protein
MPCHAVPMPSAPHSTIHTVVVLFSHFSHTLSCYLYLSPLLPVSSPGVTFFAKLVVVILVCPLVFLIGSTASLEALATRCIRVTTNLKGLIQVMDLLVTVRLQGRMFIRLEAFPNFFFLVAFWVCATKIHPKETKGQQTIRNTKKVVTGPAQHG